LDDDVSGCISMWDASSNSKIFNPILGSYTNHLEQKTLQATANCFGIKINPDIAALFLNSC
jgi:hypothetical protein